MLNMLKGVLLGIIDNFLSKYPFLIGIFTIFLYIEAMRYSELFRGLVKRIYDFFDRHAFWIGFGIIVVTWLPLLIVQEKICLQIRDCLDIEFLYRVILSKKNYAFQAPWCNIDCLMGGVPRHCFPSPLNITVLLFLITTPLIAYLINLFIVRLIAYIGMFLFLRKYVVDGKPYNILILGVAICFSLLPHLSFLGLSVAGLPLLFYAFINILYQPKIQDFFIILMFPFYSSLVLSGVFIIGALFFLFISDWIRTRRINVIFGVTWVFMILIYLFVEYNLLYGVLVDQAYVSHRIEFKPSILWATSLDNLIYLIRDVTWFGIPHAKTLLEGMVSVMLPTAFVVGFIRKIDMRKLLSVVTIILIMVMMYGLLNLKVVVACLEQIDFFRLFQCTRFIFFLPFLSYILFFLILQIVFKAGYIGRFVALLFLLYQGVFIIANSQERVSFLSPLYRVMREDKNTEELINYQRFFATKMFNEIARYINKPQSSYRVVSIGIESVVSIYNGFYTLDGLMQNYPLSYKKYFRKIIEKELLKQPSLKLYFDCWGSQCYIFSAEHPNLIEILYRSSNKCFPEKIDCLEIDSFELRKKNCIYVLSRFQIMNCKDIHLKLLKIFYDEQSAWRIYLYYVDIPKEYGVSEDL